MIDIIRRGAASLRHILFYFIEILVQGGCNRRMVSTAGLISGQIQCPRVEKFNSKNEFLITAAPSMESQLA